MGIGCVKVKKQIQHEILYVTVGGIKFPAIQIGGELKFLQQPDFSGFKTPRTALSIFSEVDGELGKPYTFYNQFLMYTVTKY